MARLASPLCCGLLGWTGREVGFGSMRSICKVMDEYLLARLQLCYLISSRNVFICTDWISLR